MTKGTRTKAGSLKMNDVSMSGHAGGGNSNSNNNENKLKQLRYKSKIYKHDIIERIVRKIQPSIYTIKSIFMTTIFTPNNPLDIIKNGNLEFSEISFYSKDALTIYIKLIDKISLSKNLELLEYSCNLFLNLLFNILETTRDKIFSDVFESNKICLKFFFIYLNTFKNDKEVVKKITNDIIRIITSTINEHDNPFYFNLIFSLYSTNFPNCLIFEFISVISNLITSDTYKGILKYSMANCKNFLILLYRILFVKNCQEILAHEYFYEMLLNFFTYISQTQLIYSKLNFNTFFTKKSYTADENNNKQRTILEILFEMSMEIYSKTKKEDFIKFLNNILIVNNVHTIFYYMDIFYFHPFFKDDFVRSKFDVNVLNAVEFGKVFKEGRNNNKFLTYYFLIKAFVYTYNYEKDGNNKSITIDYEILEKLESILYSDTQNLEIINNFNINKTEIKGKRKLI
jgi:hypothetical protein